MSARVKTPTLRIYIAQHCLTCEEALRLSEEVRKRFAAINLELIDLDKEGSENFDDVFSVPTYVLDGRTFSLGNPAPEQLFSLLSAALG
ncbi:MAG: hypothetical protein LC770_04225 [Acidobacteria bacterium]|nr:hypothetical protein [Acidobacteriota bacterium]